MNHAESEYGRALAEQFRLGDALHAAQQRVQKLEGEEVGATQRLHRTGYADAADILREVRRALAEAREAEAIAKVAYEQAQAAATALPGAKRGLPKPTRSHPNRRNRTRGMA